MCTFFMCTERKTGEERFIISEEGKMCEVVREIEWYNIQWLILFTNLLVPIIQSGNLDTVS